VVSVDNRRKGANSPLRVVDHRVDRRVSDYVKILA
jgi:hypothetical protein